MKKKQIDLQDITILNIRQRHQISPAAFAAGLLFYENPEPGLPECKSRAC